MGLAAVHVALNDPINADTHTKRQANKATSTHTPVELTHSAKTDNKSAASLVIVPTSTTSINAHYCHNYDYGASAGSTPF
jgi:hypothetical protein